MSRKKFTFLMVLVLLCSIFALAAGAAEKSYKIAVLPFDDGSIKDHWWGSYDLGKGVSDELVTALMNQTPKVFRLIEREQVEKVISEQDFGKSGRVDARTAAKIGKILGVQYLVMGKVTEFAIQTQGGKLNLLDGNSLGVKTSTARVAVDARLVDANTAEIIASVTGRGDKKKSNLSVSVDWKSIDFSGDEFRATILGQALREAVEQVSKGLTEKVVAVAPSLSGPITGTVAYAKDGKIIINIGTMEGVKTDMIFVVEHLVEEVIDPDTGEVLDTVVEKIAEIKVTDVKERSATCIVVKKLSSTLDIAVKDKVTQKQAK